MDKTESASPSHIGRTGLRSPRRAPTSTKWLSSVVILLTLLAGVPWGFSSLPSSAMTTRSPSASHVVDPLSSAIRSLQAGGGPAAGSPLSCLPASTGAEWSCHRSQSTHSSQPLLASTATWTGLGTTPPSSGWLAYDAADRYAVYLGATTVASNVAATGTWTFANGSWTALGPRIQPGWCGGASMAYDSTDKEVLYLGGANCTAQGQSWGFAGGLWTQIATSSAPPPRDFAALADDPKDGYVLLFGGANGSLRNDSWSFTGGAWTNRTATGTPALLPRFGAALAYDGYDGVMVLFGGETVDRSGFHELNDTWDFAAGKWTSVAVSKPPPARVFARLATDPSSSGLILLGGQNTSALTLFNDTWSFLAGNWTRGSAMPAPGGRWSAASLSTSGQVLLAGSPHDLGYWPPYSGSPAISWTLGKAGWSNISGSFPPVLNDFAPALAYDASDGYVLLYGDVRHHVGGNDVWSALTWTYVNGTWTNLSPTTQPSARFNQGMAYDAADGYVVLFGGSSPYVCGPTTSPNAFCQDTWEFVGGHWSQLTPAVAPPNRTQMAMAYDGGDGYVLMTGGWCVSPGGVSHPCNDTWTFSAGNWTNITSRSGAQPKGALPDMTYDAADGYVLLFGRFVYGGRFPALETWSFLGGNWTNRTASVTGVLNPIGYGVMAYDPGNGYTILFAGSFPVGTGTSAKIVDLTYTYRSGVWTNRSVDVAVAAQGTSMVYDALNGYVILFSQAATPTPGQAAYPNGLNPYWAWETSTGSAPVVTGFSAAPAVVDVGVTTTLTASVSGGTGVYTLSYGGLPTGCSSANTTRLSCIPRVAGTFGIALQVVDSGGNRTSAVLYLTVHAAPTVTLTASPSTVPIGSRVIFAATASQGTTPWSYAYTGLPPGCASQSIPQLPCRPTAVGNYTVTVTLTDAVSMTASQSTSIRVTAIGGAGAPLITSFNASPPALVLGNSTNFTVNATGLSPLTYAYSSLPSGCSGQNVSRLNCVPTSSGTYSVTVVVSDPHHNSTAASVNVTVYPTGGGAGLRVTAFGAQPGKVGVNTSTTVQVVASGGVGPIGYAYSGLPPGCASANLSSLPCTPTQVGNYSIAVRVFDAARNTAGVRTVLEVVPAPSQSSGPQVSALVISPSVGMVGQPLTIVAAVAGGTIPLSYAYTGLPSGCGTVNGPVVRCTPTAAGNFTVGLTVTDSLARTTHAAAPLEVLPAPVLAPHLGPGASVSPLVLAAEYGGLFSAGLVGAAGVLWALERRRARRAGAELVRQLQEESAAEGPPPRGE